MWSMASDCALPPERQDVADDLIGQYVTLYEMAKDDHQRAELRRVARDKFGCEHCVAVTLSCLDSIDIAYGRVPPDGDQSR